MSIADYVAQLVTSDAKVTTAPAGYRDHYGYDRYKYDRSDVRYQRVTPRDIRREWGHDPYNHKGAKL